MVVMKHKVLSMFSPETSGLMQHRDEWRATTAALLGLVPARVPMGAKWQYKQRLTQVTTLQADLYRRAACCFSPQLAGKRLKGQCVFLTCL
jgi:hypothetical protein